MDRMRFFAAVAVVCSSISAAVAADRPTGADSVQSGRHALEGTWRVEITIRNCQTGTPVRAPFPAMATFSRGGTVITSDSSIPPSLRGTGHGRWSRSGESSYEAVVEAFLFDSSGAWSGKQRFMQTVEMTGPDAIEVSVAAEISNAQGAVIGRGCASSTGFRLQ
jgi:hypothetical protein